MERTADTMAVVVDGVNGSQESARDTSRVIEQIAQEISISAEANNRISTVNRAQMENIGLLQGSLDRSLRVTLVQDNKSYESVCRDFSMTGIQLRTKDRLDSKIKLHMSVFLPYDNLADYGSQVPLQLVGKIVWRKQEGSGFACGVKFDDMIADQRQQLQICFRYFNKQSEYSPLQSGSSQV